MTDDQAVELPDDPDEPTEPPPTTADPVEDDQED